MLQSAPEKSRENIWLTLKTKAQSFLLERTAREEFVRMLAVFLAFFFMVLVAGFFISRIVREQVADNAEGMMNTAEEVIYANLREAEVAVLSSALSVEHFLLEGHTTDQIGDFIRALSGGLRHPAVSTGGFLDLYCVVNGVFISGNGWVPPADYKVAERPWYKAGLDVAGTIAYSPPYVDMDTKQVVVSASRALRSVRGETVGVIAVDININDISLYVKALAAGEGGYGALIDQNFIYLTHPNEAFVGKRMRDISPQHAELEDGFLSGATEYSAVDLTGTDGERIVLFLRKLKSGWYIAIAIPADVYYHSNRIMMIVLSALGLLFMLILNYIMIRLSRERRKADRENKSKSSFLARMSHEIRTPMNAILSLVEILLRKDLPHDAREHVAVIRQSGVTLLTLINDILDLSKMEAGQLQLDVKKYHFPALISDVKTVVRVRIASKPLEFYVRVADAIPETLIGDDIRIRQILINLLTNSVKYTRVGHIDLDVDLKPYEDKSGTVDADKRVLVVFKVIDTGIGFKPEDMRALFGEFSRFDTRRNQGIEGSGLGLSIVNNLCKAMNATIAVESVYERGTTFTVSIPQEVSGEPESAGEAPPESAFEAQADFEDAPPFTAPDVRALVVDDIETNLMVAEELLKFYELRVDTATSGADALRFAQSNRYDLIFMDHIMPEMDGVETTKRLRAAGEAGADDPAAYCRSVPIIALTANALAEYRELFLKSGFTDFLAKPIEMKKLYEILKKWIPAEKQRVSADPAPSAASSADESAAPRTDKDEPAADYPVIAGIDTRAGVRNTGGALPAYLRVLSIFRRDAEDRAASIARAVETGDTALYTTMVHALKSAARSIGAGGFGDAAERLESAGKQSDAAVIARDTPDLLAQLRALIDNIADFLRSAEPDEGNTAALSPEQRGTLRQALADMDMARIDALIDEYGKLPLSADARRVLDQIEEDILLFEYDAAIAKINGIPAE
jgi:signal transduction histidine kinase/DNA-binding NarL/FixJ family response regulator/HPt (histidine-containing phosphotransfer) domain-containing protein